jgi:PAS domain S-box-containing protein
MAARVTEPVQSKMTTLPPRAGPRAVAAERERTAFFSSLSRELRWSLDHEERFLVLDGAWQSVLGWRPERLHGWHWEEVVHPADRIRVAKTFERLRAAGGCERQVELRVAGATGGYHSMTWAFAVGSGSESILGLGHDLEEAGSTGLSSQIREIEARRDELEQRLTAMVTFAGMAAHQLAEPLIIAESSAILVAEELGEELDPALRERLDAISRGAARARRLMDALLEDARASTEPINLRTVDLGDVVDESLAAFEPRIEQQRAIVRVGPLPSVLADAGFLSVVVDNLLSNALKHGPRGGGLISFGATPLAGGRWRIAVDSGGPPIPAADVRRILEPYVRLPGERRVSGSGLGLAICMRLIERLGGRLGVEPGSVEGNTFWFELPDATAGAGA